MTTKGLIAASAVLAAAGIAFLVGLIGRLGWLCAASALVALPAMLAIIARAEPPKFCAKCGLHDPDDDDRGPGTRVDACRTCGGPLSPPKYRHPMHRPPYF